MQRHASQSVNGEMNKINACESEKNATCSILRGISRATLTVANRAIAKGTSKHRRIKDLHTNLEISHYC